ncbi:MAG: glycosyl hydrolase [bacterium]|nr:glycosyl hydrolase [bacterium]
MNLNKRQFRFPPVEYRSAPFWSWNDKLEPQELVRQINEMKQQGLGGFFMHARSGLITPYLSKEWMACIRAAVKAAKKNKMFAWLYDEDRWPSGFAGGIVPKLSKSYRMKALEYNAKTKRFKIVTMPMNNPWFNHTCYVDTLNPKAIAAFIHSTHEAYARVCGAEFGKTIPGIFTDEPNYHLDNFSIPSVPWTTGFRHYFKTKNGYDLQPHVISLFLNKGNYYQVRFDYWKTVASLFVEAYTKQIYDWCEQHGLQSTGHMLCEDNLMIQTKWIGSAMPHYEYMQQPGIDHLGRNINDIMTAKQVGSVASQLGIKRVLSEMFGCSGQNMSFLDRKWIADWHFIHGINFINEHLCLYSMKGRRKRDYPPNLYYQQPWWKYNRFIQDYFARLSYVLSQGERVNSVLVLHPIGSAWSVYTPLDKKAVETYNTAFITLSQNLLAAHWDFDYGDETILAKYGKIDGNRFCVGKQKYQVVIMPPSLTWQESTVDLLNQFLAANGKVVKIPPYPSLVDGKKDTAINRILVRSVPGSLECDTIDKILSQFIEKEITIFDLQGKNIPEIWYHHRKIGKTDFYFFANTNHERAYEAEVQIAQTGSWELWDASTGEITPLCTMQTNKQTRIRLPFIPAGSYLLRCNPESGNFSRIRLKQSLPSKIIRNIALASKWRYIRQTENALTLDYCRYQLNSKRWSARMPVIKVYELIRQQSIGTAFKIRYNFEVGFQLTSGQRVWLVVETPEKYHITVNSQKVSQFQLKDFWYDISFKKIDISAFIKFGNNTIELAGNVDKETEIESCYLIGDFAVQSTVDNSFKLVDEHSFLRSGDWVKQGYPFYAGSIVVAQEIKLDIKPKQQIYLEFDRIDATVCEVWVNQEKVTTWYWSPYTVDVTKYLNKRGNQRIELKLVNSLRNLLGPHHHQQGELLFVGPGSFRDWNNWTDKYHFVPFGIKGGKLVIYQ